MKTILKTLAVLLIGGAMMAPTMDAQGRGARGDSRSQSSATVNRGNQNAGSGRTSSGGFRGNNNVSNSKPTAVTPSRNERPSGSQQNNINRPGHRPDNGNVGNRPDNRPDNGNAGHRPGNRPDNGNVGHRPDNRPGQQPGHNNFGPQGNNRPGGGHPDHGYNPGPRPGIPAPGVRPAPDRRPPMWRPAPRPWVAPVPPHHWRPGPIVPKFSTILGLTIGSAIHMSLDYLLGHGYTVYSYNNDMVYLNNVNQLNMLWPDATLYYGHRGLQRGDFVYYTPYYDTYRYNLAYSRLVANYGNPVMTTYPADGMQTQWFGPDGRFVTLTYQPMYGEDGVMRYYTTLSFGF